MLRRLTPLVVLLGTMSCLNGSSTDATTTSDTGPFAAVSTELKDSSTATAAAILLVRAHVTHDGAAVPLAPVKFSVVAGHGLVSVDSTTTDTLGVATVLWTLGDSAQLNTLAILSGDGADTLHVIAVPGSPSYLVPVSPTASDIAVNTPLTIQVRVTDRPGNAVAGATVFWTTSGGSLAASSSVTDGTGLARVTFTSAAAGSFTVSAVLPETATRDFQVTVR